MAADDVSRFNISVGANTKHYFNGSRYSRLLR
jgi:hypothetical protein